MQPRGLLMIEHRLIMRMMSLIDKEVKEIEKNNMANQSFIDKAVDFIRTYADQTHHGKEENILFRDLSKKKLSDTDDQILKELIHEHSIGRDTTAGLVKSSAAFQKGDTAALPAIAQYLRKFADFYPKHIEKEDNVFFPASMMYFSEPEQKAMLDEFLIFDAKMIHDKYKSIIGSLEK